MPKVHGNTLGQSSFPPAPSTPVVITSWANVSLVWEMHGTWGAVVSTRSRQCCILKRCPMLALSSLLTRANSQHRAVSNSYMARQDAFWWPTDVIFGMAANIQPFGQAPHLALHWPKCSINYFVVFLHQLGMKKNKSPNQNTLSTSHITCAVWGRHRSNLSAQLFSNLTKTWSQRVFNIKEKLIPCTQLLVFSTTLIKLSW